MAVGKEKTSHTGEEEWKRGGGMTGRRGGSRESERAVSMRCCGRGRGFESGAANGPVPRGALACFNRCTFLSAFYAVLDCLIGFELHAIS